MKNGIIGLLLGTALLLAASATTGCRGSEANYHAESTAERPNIVLILADDLGYGDPRIYNASSKIPTPNIDRLAREGMRFTDAHTPSSVCTPTRYSLLTGRYAWRTHLKEGVLDGFDPPLIEPDRLTLASLLRQHGYFTAAVGKWHLGMQWTDPNGDPIPLRDTDRGGFRPGSNVDFTEAVTGGPTDRGFDYFFGISASLDMSPYVYIENDRTVGIPDIETPEDKSLFMNQVPGVRTEDFELADVMPTITERAVSIVEEQEKTTNSFFLYFPLSAPHLPIVPNDTYGGRSQAGEYGDFVVEVDAAVGALLDALERTGQAENTLVLFTSDNGGLWHWWEFTEKDDVAHGQVSQRGDYVRSFGHQSNAHLRGTKADIWEGGHRVPLITRWPAKVPAGTTNDELVELTDIMAMTAALLGEELPDDAGEDSYNILPALLRQDYDGAIRNSSIHHSLRGMFAIRQGPWKLIKGRGSGGFSRPRSLTPGPDGVEGQLYNLAVDPAETENVYAAHPDIVERLSSLLDQYRRQGFSRPRGGP